MTKEVSAMEFRRKFGKLLDGVYYKDDRLIVTRASKPMAAIIPIETYQQFLRTREDAFAKLEHTWATMPDVPEAEVEADVERAIAEVRAQKGRKPAERGRAL